MAGKPIHLRILETETIVVFPCGQLTPVAIFTTFGCKNTVLLMKSTAVKVVEIVVIVLDELL